MILFPSAYLHEVVCIAHGNHAFSKQHSSMEWQSGAAAVQSLKTKPDKRPRPYSQTLFNTHARHMTRLQLLRCYTDTGNGRLTSIPTRSAAPNSKVSFPSACLNLAVCAAYNNHALSKQHSSMEW